MSNYCVTLGTNESKTRLLVTLGFAAPTYFHHDLMCNFYYCIKLIILTRAYIVTIKKNVYDHCFLVYLFSNEKKT